MDDSKRFLAHATETMELPSAETGKAVGRAGFG